MKKNVLVFPCGTEIGLEIHRALANSTHFNIIGANSSDDHGKYVYKNYIDNLPFIDDELFVDKLNNMIKEHNIDFIIPAHDSVVLKMADYEYLIDAQIITSEYETCNICRSKKRTYNFFKDIIKVPIVYDIADTLNYPIFLKPDIGQGSKGTHKIQSNDELDFYTKQDKSLLVLEYLPGKEYTIDCFTNHKGELLFAKGRLRKRINNGISVNSIPIENKEFLEIANKINDNLKFRGAWFFQVKENLNGELVLMEIAPRIAGTMALYRNLGINFILLSLFDRMNIDVKITENKYNIEIDRALCEKFQISVEYDYVYVDLDDTLIIDNKVNTSLISYLYQARNDKKIIILITKHIGNVKETLNKYAISESLFEYIIHIDSSYNKSKFMNEKSIFIDDSFSERYDVHMKGIPVFSIDMIESLINYKK
jgi:predicted ATP-grasp superfamily ATP-dependent carboligase